MTLQLAAIAEFLVHVASLAPFEGAMRAHHSGIIHAIHQGDGVVLGMFTRQHQSCKFEALVQEGCVVRAKGCHLAGQAPVCP